MLNHLHMCTVVLWTKVVIELYICKERIAVIKKRTGKQNAMRVALNVIACNNLLCEIVSRSGCEYCISSSSNLSNLSNTVPNSFGISNKVLLGTSD